MPLIAGAKPHTGNGRLGTWLWIQSCEISRPTIESGRIAPSAYEQCADGVHKIICQKQLFKKILTRKIQASYSVNYIIVCMHYA